MTDNNKPRWNFPESDKKPTGVFYYPKFNNKKEIYFDIFINCLMFIMCLLVFLVALFSMIKNGFNWPDSIFLFLSVWFAYGCVIENIEDLDWLNFYKEEEGEKNDRYK